MAGRDVSTLSFDSAIQCQNHSGWKRPSRASSTTFDQTPSYPLKYILRAYSNSLFKHFLGWQLHHFHWTACSSDCQSLDKENFAHIQPKPSLVQHEAISSCPVKSFLGEEIPPHYSFLAGCVEKMQSNIATVFILVFQPFHPCDGGCSKGLLPTLRGCLGNNWAKTLWPFF